MKTKIFIGYAIMLIGSMNGCKKSDTTPATPASPGTNEVWMQNTAFNPSTITVTKNTTVKWTNKDGMNHTVTSDSSWFDSGIVSSGGTYSRQFTATGTFPYRCTIHSNMTGKVIVQ
jgi:plastocyanin